MPRSVTFNGVTKIAPGAIVKVTTEDTTPLTGLPAGIIGLIGEAEGGEPGIRIVVDDPSQAKTIFRAGPLADALRPLFQPSNDERVPGGAFRAVCYRVNAGTQATRQLKRLFPSADDPQLFLKSRDYGSHTNNINVTFGADALDGRLFSFSFEADGITETLTGLGGLTLMTIAYKGPEESIFIAGSGGVKTYTQTGNSTTVLSSTAILAANVRIGQYVRVLTNAVGPSAVGEYRRISAVTDGVSVTVDTVFSAAVQPGATFQITSLRIVGGIIQSVPSSTTVVVTQPADLAGGGQLLRVLTPSTLNTLLFRVTGGVGEGQLRPITAVNVAANVMTLTLAEPLGVLPQGLNLFPTDPSSWAIIDVEAATASVTGTAGKATTLTSNVNFGASVGTVGVGSVTCTNAAPWDLEPAQTLTTAIDGAGALTATFNATAASIASTVGAPFNVSANTTLRLTVNGGPVQTVTIVSPADAANLAAVTQQEMANWLNAKFVSIQATATTGNKVTIATDRRGTGATLAFANLVANPTDMNAIMIWADAVGTGNVANIDAVTQAEAATIINAVAGFTTGATLTQNANGTLTIATKNGGSGGSIQMGGTAASVFGFSTSLVSSGAITDLNITLNSPVTRSIADTVALINGTLASAGQPTAGSSYLAAVGAGRDGAILATAFDFGSGSLNTTIDLRYNPSVINAVGLVFNPYTASRLYDNLAQLANAINAQSQFVSATRCDNTAATGGAGSAGAQVGATTPDPLSGSVYLAGGIRGTSTNAAWQTAFDSFLKDRTVTGIVPLIERNLADLSLSSTALVETVHAQLVSHVAAARADGSLIRFGVASIRADEKAGKQLQYVLDQVKKLGDYDVHLVFQRQRLLNVNGDLAIVPEWASACIYAGMRASLDPGGSGMHKYVRTANVQQHASLDPANKTILNQLLSGGCIVFAEVPGRGFWIVDDITTHLATNKLQRIDGGVASIIRFVTRDFNDFVENEIVGNDTPVTKPGLARQRCARKLDGYKQLGIIVDGVDPVTGQRQNAWRNLKLVTSGDITTIEFEIIAKTTTRYALVTINTKLPFVVA